MTLKSLTLLFLFAVLSPLASLAEESDFSAKKEAAQDFRTGISISVMESMFAAIQNNFDIQLQKAVPKIAGKEVKMAESEFDPTLFGELNHAESKTPSTSAFASPQIGELSADSVSVGLRQKLKLGTTYELSLQSVKIETNSAFAGINPEYDSYLTFAVSQPLLKGRGWDVNTTNVFVAGNVRNMSEREFEIKVMQVLTNTRESYWDMVYLNKELEVQEESLMLARDFLERVRLQVEVGVKAPIEIVAAEAFVAVREEALIGIWEQIGNNQDRLKALLNINSAGPGSPIVIFPADKPEYKPVILNIEKLKEAAFQYRPDYVQARLELENRERQVAYYRNQALPNLGLYGSVTYKGVRGPGRTFKDFITNETRTSAFSGNQADSFSDVASGRYYDYSVGLTAEYPLFNRLARSRVSKSALEHNMAQTNLRKLKQAIEVDVYRSAREVEAAEQKIKATEASRVLAEKKLEAETKKYEVGTSTGFAVLEYQKDLAVEKSKEIKAVIDHLKAIARLELATGTVLSNNNIALEFMAP